MPRAGSGCTWDSKGSPNPPSSKLEECTELPGNAGNTKRGKKQQLHPQRWVTSCRRLKEKSEKEQKRLNSCPWVSPHRRSLCFFGDFQLSGGAPMERGSRQAAARSGILLLLLRHPWGAQRCRDESRRGSLAGWRAQLRSLPS